MLRIDKHTRWIAQARLVTFDHTSRRDVACIRLAEHQNRTVDVVRNEKFARVRVDRHGAGPIQLCFRPLDDSHGWRVSTSLEWINSNRWRFESARSRNLVVADVAPVVNEQKFVLRIDGNTVRIR